MQLENIAQNKVHDGWHKRYRHAASSTQCPMTFAIYLPPQASKDTPVPVVYWLSGLTCTDENFMQKAGAFKRAAELGIAIVAPDTSPRGEDVADDKDYDLGQGAGFYVNATQAPWNKHYNMYDYVVNELPELIETHFPVTQQRALAGHSMGGHGALVIGLTASERYSSVSAFSPIANPIACPWGQKAFSAYLGGAEEDWYQYDAVRLLSRASDILPMRIDQGLSDPFLDEQLGIEKLERALAPFNHKATVHRHAGYDHSYFFISSFIDAHLTFHADYFNR
ncbi:S-formylglutathione hydrolase [Aestuariibacter sp. AA17]|uniref:S-formylglutathione hydrolase n=1 Tax=Fluctibacter corallii TaxID=2984329 RepID=A0ABT3A954_9ALTE|nr:S-formylglutathione hydrolase [Aestuariibacter sp. AA17]MCV2884851.1 S-formylglutathione hydrolase [Aestuariibacter sp. AA17]